MYAPEMFNNKYHVTTAERYVSDELHSFKASAPFLVIAVLLISILTVQSSAVAQEVCVPCTLPCALGPTDTLMDAYLVDGRVLQNVRSARREFVRVFGEREQGVRFYFPSGSGCRDTLLRIADVLRLEYGGVGALGAPRSVQILPVREFFRSEDRTIRVPLSFVEITPFLAYGGSDTSSREIGFSSVYGGLEALAAPFGSLLGEDLALAIGGGILLEGGRTRFPVSAHLRWTFTGKSHIEESTRYGPDSCRFACGTFSGVPASPGKGYSERESPGRKDSSSIILHDTTVIMPQFRPFLFVEGGRTFDGAFQGAGTDNAINKEDYAPYFYGGGIGTPIGRYLTVSLAYRRMQLHLLTPCEACAEKNIVNTNRIHSLLLKVGGRFAW